MGNLADRVKETTTTAGTGTVSLAGNVASYVTVVAGHGNGSIVDYCIEHITAAEWEIGEGVVTDGSPDTLTRVTVWSSSNAGLLVNFSAGIKNVFCSPPAQKLPLLHLAQTFTAIQTFTTDIRGGRIFLVAGDYTSLVNDAPWYGIGPSNLNYGGGVVQVAGWGGLNFQTATGRMIMRGDTGRVAIGTASWSGDAVLTVAPVPSVNWTINGSDVNSYVTLANNATYDLAAGSGLVMVHPNDADFALMIFNVSSGATTIISDPSSYASGTQGTANKYNVYFNAGTGKYTLENKRGASRSVYITSIMTRPSS